MIVGCDGHVVRSQSRSRPSSLRFGPGDRAIVAHLVASRSSLLDYLSEYELRCEPVETKAPRRGQWAVDEIRPSTSP